MICSDCGATYFSGKCNCKKKQGVDCYNYGRSCHNNRCPCDNQLSSARHEAIMYNEENRRAELDPKQMAKGLVYFRRHHPVLYKTIPRESFDKVDTDIWLHADDLYNGTVYREIKTP